MLTIYQNLFQSLTKGSLTDLNQTASTLLNNPFVVCDTDYTILAQFPNHTIGDDFFDRMFEKKTLDTSMFQVVQADKYQEALDKNDHILYLDYGIAAKIPRYIASILSNQKVIGFIAVLELDSSFDSSTKTKIQLICQAYSIYLSQKILYDSTKEVYSNYLSRSIFVEESLRDEQLQFLKNRYLTTKHFRICSTNITNKRNLIVLLTKYKKYLDRNTKCITSIIENTMYILYPDQTTSKEEFTKLLNASLKHASIFNLHFGISDSFSDLSKIPFYKAQAEHASSYLLDYSCFFSDILLEDYIKAIEKSADHSIYRHPILNLLKNHDHAHQTELYRTLQTFILSMNDSSYTTNKLNIHRNTLLYRLDKIEQMGHFSIKDKHLCQQLFLNFIANTNQSASS